MLLFYVLSAFLNIPQLNGLKIASHPYLQNVTYDTGIYLSNHVGLILIAAGDNASGTTFKFIFSVFGGIGQATATTIKNIVTEGSIAYGGDVTVSNVNDKIVITTTNSIARFLALYY